MTTTDIVNWLKREVKNPELRYEVMDAAKLLAKKLHFDIDQEHASAPQELFEDVLAGHKPASPNLLPGQPDFFAHWLVSSLIAVCTTRNEMLSLLSAVLEDLKWERDDDLRPMRRRW